MWYLESKRVHVVQLYIHCCCERYVLFLSFSYCTWYLPMETRTLCVRNEIVVVLQVELQFGFIFFLFVIN
jgi:hypothetical protein